VDLKSLSVDAILPKDIVLSLIDQLEIKYQEKIYYIEDAKLILKTAYFMNSAFWAAPDPEKKHIFIID
jgi:hypothetical protein